MKKRIVTLAILIITFACGLMIYNIISNLGQKKVIENIQGNLSMVLTQMERTDLDSLATTVLFFFNSECEHCQYEMTQISENVHELQKFQILLVSFEQETKAVNFLNQYGLSQYYLKSSPDRVMSVFKGAVPQIFIYKKNKLKKHFKGEVKIEAVISAVNAG